MSKIIHTAIASLLTALILLTMAGCMDTDTNPTDSGKGTDSNSSADTDTKEYSVGETAEIGDTKITLVDVRETQGDEMNTPSDGNVFVLAEFEIENTGDADLTVNSMLSFDAYRDGESADHSLKALLENEKSLLDGIVATGEKTNGCIGYELPSDYKELKIHVKPDAASDHTAVFVYKK